MSAVPPILIRCDGSPEIGFGHVVRCLALADELHYNHRCRVAFAMRGGRQGFEAVRAKGYPVLAPPDGEPPFRYTQWMEDAIRRADARGLVLDVRDDFRREDADRLRKSGILVVVLDDLSDRRLAADLVFYPPVPQVGRLDWAGFEGKLHISWDVIPLRREFAHCPRRVSGGSPVILVTMGGSDPGGLTVKTLGALDRIERDFVMVVVLGPGFCHEEKLSEQLPGMHHRCEVLRGVEDMASVMSRAHLAVASFGVTAYELAAAGVPAIYLCLTEDHAESATALANAGAGISMGHHRGVSESALAEAASRLLNDGPALERMSLRGREAVDGRGAGRIARAIVEAMGETA